MKRLLLLLALFSSSLISLELMAQSGQVTVSGTVIDNVDNLGLPGVTVSVGSPERALTATDAEGRFSVSVESGSTLHFHLIGFLDRSVTLKAGQTSLQVTLSVDDNQLEEVVVRGYVTRSKEETTGSSFTITAEEIQDVPVANVESLLQGKVPGLNIQVNTGAPGFRGSTQIRGLSTLAVSGSGSETFLQPTSPLYVIDGVPMDADKASEFGFQQQGPGISPLSMIPQEDIASIEILKDAQATSLYGSRAAYGVIIITTKRGNSKIPRIRYRTNFFVKTPPKLRETLGGNAERRLKINQIRQNTLSPYDLERISWTPFLADSLNSFYNNSTDWQSIFYQTTYNQTHNLAIDGGDTKFNYKANLGYYAENGIIKNTGFDRYNLTMNMEFKPTDKLRFFGSMFGSIGKQKKGDGVGLLQQGVAENGQSSTLLPGPSFFQASSGVISALQTENDNSARNLRTNLDVRYTVIEGMNIASSISYDFTANLEDTFTPAAANQQFAEVYAFAGRDYTLYNRNSITYSKDFNDDHGIFVNVFNEFRKGGSQNRVTRQARSPEDQLQGPWGFDGYFSRGGGVLTNFKDAREASFAGAISYNFRKKYIVDFTYHMSGSSGSGSENPYSKFPAIGLKWNFYRENWFQNSDWLSSGALRLTWGKNVMPSRSLDALYGKYNLTGNYNNNAGILIDFDKLPNPFLKPTTTEQYNFGFDAALFNNRIDLIFDAYYKEVQNLEMERFLTNSTGFNKFYSNDAAIANYGYELYVNVRPLSPSSPVTWNLSVNGAINKDVLIALPEEFNNQTIKFDGGEYKQHTLFRVGSNTLSNYLSTNEGVFATDADVPVDPATGLRYRTGGGAYFEGGDPMLKDVNQDYIMDSRDYEMSGNSQPLVTGGLSTTISYKGFGLNVYASFTLKRTVLNNALAERFRLMGDPFGSKAVVPLENIDMWLQPGDLATYPYAYDYSRYSRINPFRLDQTLWAEDGSYLKINNVTLSYMFTKKTVRRLGLANLRIYFSTDNLVTFSPYSGPNPENVTSMGRDASGGYPVARTYNVGLNLEL
ncbi:SusC/RagA family TonB-linked outer membrane protein [Anseongella ginsenosidimutans]|nr:SusC/RagA family TonB-linked outer membrane protein [Anseongella ginsenosidimutans]QEC54009.1 SusC/RagA family TonB-linked outer membrane protein [Anseongella ginsenosidimutans]